MTVEIDNQLSGALRTHDVVDGDRQVAAPAISYLLALLSGDLHFFDNRAPFL